MGCYRFLHGLLSLARHLSIAGQHLDHRKELVERLDSGDTEATGIDPNAVAYTPLGELEGAGEKAIRDAGTIPVAAI
jgi:hypothetical protein